MPAPVLWEDSYTAEEPHWALVRLPQGGGKGGLAGIPARAAATANVASLTGLQTIDGVTLVAGDTLLLPWQTDKKANGTYKVGTSAWERTGTLESDILVLVRRGAVNGHSIWMLVNETDPVIGVDDIQFEAMTAAFGGFSS
ncbi:MAG: hypothetical protein NTW87_10925 [Planctomycetota bacterium]|nr:hypothetical protein [Planctomycetota bacterium]